MNIRSTQSYDGFSLVNFIFSLSLIFTLSTCSVLGNPTIRSIPFDVLIFLGRLQACGKYSYLKRTAIYFFLVRYTHNYDTNLLKLPGAFLHQCTFWTLIGPVINEYSCVWQ